MRTFVLLITLLAVLTPSAALAKTFGQGGLELTATDVLAPQHAVNISHGQFNVAGTQGVDPGKHLACSHVVIHGHLRRD